MLLFDAIRYARALAFSATTKVEYAQRIAIRQLLEQVQTFQSSTPQAVHENNANIAWLTAGEQRSLEVLTCCVANHHRFVVDVLVLA